MKCDWCEQEMTDHVSCTENHMVNYPNGEVLPSIPSESDCHDCGCPAGGKHHPGCDMERCPKCKGQLIACGCLNSEDD